MTDYIKRLESRLGLKDEETAKAEVQELAAPDVEPDFDIRKALRQAQSQPKKSPVQEQEEIEADGEVQRRLEALDLQIGPWKTGYKWSDIPVVGDDLAAGLVGLGHMMTDSYRGIKQMGNIDIEEEQQNEKYVNELYADEMGKQAYAGAIMGAIADPVGLAMGGPLGWVAGKATKAAKLNKIADIATKTAAVGAVQAGTGFVDEEALLNERWQMAAAGGTVGAVLGTVAGKLASKAEVKQGLVDQDVIEEAEDYLASKVMAGASPETAAKLLKENAGELSDKVKDVAERTGKFPDVDEAIKNWGLRQEAAKGEKPIDTIKPSEAGQFRNGVDRFIGVISSRVKNVSPRWHGKLRQYEAAITRRPETFRKQRDPFAQYFRTHSDRKVKKAVTTFSDDDVQELNHMLVNGKLADARNFILVKRGEEAAQTFDDALKVMDDIGDELVEYGIIKEKIPNYWPRQINKTRIDEFLEKFGKDAKNKTEWENHLADLEAKSMGKRGHKLADTEVTDAFNKWVMREGGDYSFFGSAQQRKIKNVRRQWIEFYNDPLASMDSYIHRSVHEIEKAKLLGKNAYKSAQMQSKKDGLMDINKAFDAMEATELRGMRTVDAEELRHLLKLRFGHGMVSPATATGTYKALVNMTLLGNPIAALTQLGDLGVSMYKNGVLRTIGTTLSRKKIKVADLGLEKHYQEFEDIAKKKGLQAAQDFLFKWSGFRAVDALGKETFVNSAVKKASDIVKNPGSKAYKQWARDTQPLMGEDFDKLVTSLRNIDEDGVDDHILTYAHSKLSDVQPISRSEVPEYYLSSNLGKAAFTLKTFMIKQLDILRNDVWNNLLHGGAKAKVEAGKNLAAYTAIVGATNMGADKLKALVSGQDSWEDLPEEVQISAVANLLPQLPLSALKSFGITEFSIKQIQQGRAYDSVQDQVMPPAPVVDELMRIAYKLSTGELEGADVKRLWRYMPYLGRFQEFPEPIEEGIVEPVTEALGLEERAVKLAEGGLVEAEDTKIPLEEVIPEDPKDNANAQPEQAKEEKKEDIT